MITVNANRFPPTQNSHEPSCSAGVTLRRPERCCDASDPDDAALGGRLIFDFDQPVDLVSLDVIDFERGGSIRALDENGDLIGRVRLPKGHDGGESTIELRFEDATRLIVRLNDSAAIDDLVFSIESQIAALAKAGPDVV